MAPPGIATDECANRKCRSELFRGGEDFLYPHHRRWIVLPDVAAHCLATFCERSRASGTDDDLADVGVGVE